MGLFNTSDTCAVCGGKTNALTRVKLKDGFLCGTCKTWCSSFLDIKSMSSEDARAHIAKALRDEEIYKSLVPTDSVGRHFVVFGNDKMWSCSVKKGETPYLFSFDDIINYELLEDGTSITKGGLGTAAVGAFLFGGVGAIVGGSLGKKQSDIVHKIGIRISTKIPLMSHIEISVFSGETKRGGIIYRSSKEVALKILSLLDQITSSHAPVSNGEPTLSEADEILKFKQLLDSGIITQEEFDAKKRQLLDL